MVARPFDRFLRCEAENHRRTAGCVTRLEHIERRFRPQWFTHARFLAGANSVNHNRWRQQFFAVEAEIASQAIARGMTEPPEPAPGWAERRGNTLALDRWRADIGYEFRAAYAAVNKRLAEVRQTGLSKIARRSIPGFDQPVSILTMGCDNRDRFAGGAPTWDVFMGAGGNAFDTAFVNGGVKHEAALGEWIAARGVSKDVVVIAKGAHSPTCLPSNIEPQLAISLERLRLDRVPIYICRWRETESTSHTGLRQTMNR